MKLHLGCGATYLSGYHNVDLPTDEQSVQTGVRPDEYADIMTLAYSPGSIEEVRLHHVFEHFERPAALRLLIDWHEWLEPSGQLVIETPDFGRCARAMLFALRPSRRMRLLRHIFGSHEARWAVHCEGWDRRRFKLVLRALHYQDIKFDRSSWRGTYNITVTARKAATPVTRAELENAAGRLLALSLVDDSESEQRLLALWVSELQRGNDAMGGVQRS